MTKFDLITEKVSDSLYTLTKSDIDDKYIIWYDDVNNILKNDPDKDIIIDIVDKILNYINENTNKINDILNTEVSDLVKMFYK